jgi:NAD(P)-dependent dehydrogenase (short-subunit alcohol dehydrogenase family)
MTPPRSPQARQAGRHCIVTGAGTGIGRAIALRLAAEGARLSLLARDVDRLRATAQASGAGERVFVSACDVRERKSVARAFAAAAEAAGPVHVLVANSGVGGPNEAGSEDRFDDLVATNLIGTYACMRAAHEHLAEGPGVRHLIAISSILARIGVPGYTGYCASKAGILGLVRALSCELAPENIQVNAVCPGWVDTAMAREGLEGMAKGMQISAEAAHAKAMESVPRGRMSEPEEIAGVVSWLASEDALGVTGQAVDVNGGAFMI